MCCTCLVCAIVVFMASVVYELPNGDGDPGDSGWVPIFLDSVCSLVILVSIAGLVLTCARGSCVFKTVPWVLHAVALVACAGLTFGIHSLVSFCCPHALINALFLVFS